MPRDRVFPFPFFFIDKNFIHNFIDSKYLNNIMSEIIVILLCKSRYLNYLSLDDSNFIIQQILARMYAIVTR